MKNSRVVGLKDGRRERVAELAGGTRDRFLAEEEPVAKLRRVFVNRNLKMKNVKTIGFDMDHTLALYQKVPIETLAFDETKKKMVDELGYPERLLELQYDPDFVIRGLVVDKVRGNLIKMDRHKYAARAYHGKRKLSRDERKETYANKKLTVYDKDFISIDTLFTLPEGDIFAQIIDLIEIERVEIKKTYSEIFQDVRLCIDKAHRDNSMKAKILASPGRYFIRDPKLPLALDKFVRGGKKLFIVTNSAWDYTEKVMHYLLSNELEDYPHWRDYFDFVVVDAGKPDFFKEGKPLEKVEDAIDPDTRQTDHRVFRFGNAASIEQLTGLRCDEILYVGDHTHGDILRSKKSSFWRTMMVVEEMEKELESADRVRQITMELEKIYEDTAEMRLQANVQLEQIGAIRETKAQDYNSLDEDDFNRMDQECEKLWRKVARIEAKITRSLARAKKLEVESERAFNPYWGPLFKVGRETSRFGDQVEDFACVYTVKVSNFLYYPTNKYFQTNRKVMPHEV